MDLKTKEQIHNKIENTIRSVTLILNAYRRLKKDYYEIMLHNYVKLRHSAGCATEVKNVDEKINLSTKVKRLERGKEHEVVFPVLFDQMLKVLEESVTTPILRFFEQKPGSVYWDPVGPMSSLKSADDCHAWLVHETSRIMDENDEGLLNQGVYLNMSFIEREGKKWRVRFNYMSFMFDLIGDKFGIHEKKPTKNKDFVDLLDTSGIQAYVKAYENKKNQQRR